MKAKCLTYILLFVLFASIGRSGVWTSGLTIINHSTNAAFTVGVHVYRTAYNQDKTWGGGTIDMLWALDSVGALQTKVYGPYYDVTGTLVPGAPGYYGEVWYQIGGQPAVKFGTYPYCCDNINDVDTTIILNVDGNNEYVPVCTTNLYWHSLNTTAYWRLYSVVNVATSAAENSQLIGPNSYYTYSKTVPCSQANDYELYASGGNGDDNVQPTGDKGITNGVPTDPGTNNVSNGGSVTNSAPPTLQPTNSTLPAVTNADQAILWSNTNNDVSGVTSATKDSGQALFNAANQAAAQNHSDLAGINDSINAVRNQAHADATNANNGQNAMANQAHQDSQSAQNLASTAATMAHNDANDLKQLLSGITNAGVGGLTNYALETTQKSVDQSLFTIKGTVAGISNLLSGLFADYGTNAISDSTNALEVAGFDTNSANDLHTNFSLEVAGETNNILAELASRTASPELALIESDLATFIEGFKLDEMDDRWPAPPMTYTFQWFGGSKTIDFNPMNYHLDGSAQISEIFSASKTLWSWLLAIIYLARCARDAGKAIEMCEMARGVTVTSPTTKKTYT